MKKYMFITLGLCLCLLSAQYQKVASAFFDASVPSPTPALEALLKFEVEIPADSPLEEGIDLLVLDEVSGLMLNPLRYTMRARDARNYELELPFQIGSVLKYRYARHGNSLVAEYNAQNKPVRYRLFRVDGAGMRVSDIVSRWEDTQSPKEVGTLEGEISDAQKKKPLVGLLVYCGGNVTKSDKNGKFQIQGLPPGKHNLVVNSAEGGYLTFQQEAIITAGNVTLATFSMQKTETVTMVFSVNVPADTPAHAQVRIAGSLLQLGNAFRDLRGGVNGKSEQMPLLKQTSEGRYMVALNLPSGVFVQYKYTLGNGYWNAERDGKAAIRLRQFIVPSQGRLILDEVLTWRDSQKTPYMIDYLHPFSNPPKKVAVQLYVFQWSETILLWQTGVNRWTYTLFSPLKILPAEFKYRFCLDKQCEE